MRQGRAVDRVMGNEPEQNKKTKPFWPVTFTDVEETQLKATLAMTPAQRLAMAEELLEFVRLAETARAQAARKAR